MAGVLVLSGCWWLSPGWAVERFCDWWEGRPPTSPRRRDDLADVLEFRTRRDALDRASRRDDHGGGAA